MIYDVIVAGAGPAGSTAAKELAARGRSVLVLERTRHPRRKVCGGCLSSRIDNILGTQFHEIVERSVREVVFAYGSERYFYHKSPSNFAYLIQREPFDKYLAEEAVRAGAKIHEDEQVVDVEEGPAGVRVTTTTRRYESAYLVGADGVSSIVARRLGLTGGRYLGLACEADIKLPVEGSINEGGILTIGVGDVSFGYGWVFPKAGSASVGVAGERRHVGDIKQAFERFLIRQGRFSDEKDISPTGYYLASIAGDHTPIQGLRSLLVGDAAGFADPLLGEGIYYSVLSAQKAARIIDHAIEGAVDVSLYRSNLKEEIFEEFEAARIMAGLFYRFPRFGYYVLEKSDVIEGLCNVLRGKSSYRDQLNKLKSVGGPEVLRYFGVLRSARRGKSRFSGRSSLLNGGFRMATRSMLAKGAMTRLRRYIGEHVPDGGLVLNVSGRAHDTLDLICEESNPSRIINLIPYRRREGFASLDSGKFERPRIQADLLHLPYRNESFDTVICAEGIEELKDPRSAVREFLRVIRLGGSVIYVFSALPVTGRGRLTSYLLEHLTDWPFLPSGDQPFHRCEVSRITVFAGGLIKVAVLGKCCNVEEPMAPCITEAEDTRDSEPDPQVGADSKEDSHPTRARRSKGGEGRQIPANVSA